MCGFATRRAVRAARTPFLLKDAAPEELLAAIDTVARGEVLLAPAVTRAVIDAFVRAPRARPDHAATLEDLTPHEYEVLELVAEGRSNAEIAEALVITEATVKSHIAHPDEGRRARPRPGRDLRLPDRIAR